MPNFKSILQAVKAVGGGWPDLGGVSFSNMRKSVGTTVYRVNLADCVGEATSLGSVLKYIWSQMP